MLSRCAPATAAVAILSVLAAIGCDRSNASVPSGIEPPPGPGNLDIDFTGVWQVTEILTIEGDAGRAPELGEVIVFGSDRLLSFGSTDVDTNALATEAGPVENYLNVVGPDTSRFFVQLGFRGQRTAEIGISTTAESPDQLLLDLFTTVTDPTTIRMRAIRTELDAGDAPSPPESWLSVNERAGVYAVTSVAPRSANPEPPPAILPPLEGSLVEVDLNGRVTAFFGVDPFDPIPPGATVDTLLSRATGREILAQRSLVDVFGTESSVSLRASVLDSDRLIGSFFDAGVLFVDLGLPSLAADIEFERVEQPIFCFGIEEARWDFTLTQGTNIVLDLGNETGRHVSLEQLQCVVRLDVRTGGLGSPSPIARSSLHGGLALDGRWTPRPTGAAFSQFENLELEGSFLTSTHYVGTWTSSNLGSGRIEGRRHPN